MVVVIDTNCLLASVPPQSDHYWLYLAFKEQKFTWLISNEIILEYEEKLAEYYSERTANLVLSILNIASNVTFIEPFYKWNLIEKDADDNKFVDIAIVGNADYLVTNDADFKVLKKIDFPKINVVSINEFKKIVFEK